MHRRDVFRGAAGGFVAGSGEYGKAGFTARRHWGQGA
jgi:hypothetical protein